jgi:phospholipase/carboxylesterase
VRTDRLADLDVCVTGGSDGRGNGDGPLVVMLHGFGAAGDDLVPLARVIPAPAGTRWLFPAAPFPLPGPFAGGRAWWMVDFERRERLRWLGREAELSQEVPEGLAAARDGVTALLDAAQAALGARPEATVLGGFSQGAMLACDVALRDPRPWAGLALLSPTLIAAPEWEALAPGRAGMPVFMSHGRGDPLLPFPFSERLRDLLAGAGLAVTWRPFEGGHEVGPGVVEGLAGFLGSTLGGTPAP